MGRGPAALNAVLLAAALAGCREPAVPLTRGTRLDLAALPGHGAALVWVVPAAEFRVCAPVAGVLRRSQAANGGSLVVVFVGSHPEWMAAYLRSQRLHAGLVALSTADYVARFGKAPFHALYRVRGGRVEESLPPDPSRLEARLRAGFPQSRKE